VRYILVGGYAVVLHGYIRTTGDLDIWVEPTAENYTRLAGALDRFGIPKNAISAKAFLRIRDNDVFTFGRPPVSIDLMTDVRGLDFTTAFKDATMIEVDGLSVRLLDLMSLITAKKAAGRYKDLDDIEHLTEEE